MTQPVFPLICISKDNSLDLIPKESYFSKVATSALLDTSVFGESNLFDRNGNVWTYYQYSEKFRNNFLTRLLTNTFYNPILDAKVVWTHSGKYHFSDLKTKIKLCIDSDDDIITQFEDSEILKFKVDEASTFDEIFKALKLYVFQVD